MARGADRQCDGDGVPRQRRTQAQRRATTRAALLDATIDGLVEHGYAQLTTAHIVQRAGVTRGAQAYYFSTKEELVVEALWRLAERLVAEVTADPPPRPTAAEDLVRAYLDGIWRVHTGAIFTAAVELWVAARTDPGLREPLVAVDRHLIRSLFAISEDQVPELAGQPGFRAWLQTALAAMRGLAMLRFVREPAEVERMWVHLRGDLEAGVVSRPGMHETSQS